MLEVIIGIAVVGLVISKQLSGMAITGKRLILLPVVLAVIGLVSLGGHDMSALAVGLIAGSAVIAAGIGALQGFAMQLSSRDGFLWGQMPLKSLWLWVALIASRVATMAVGAALGAHLDIGSSILFALAINRLAQAAVIGIRAYAAGIPFAPEKDGQVFLGHLFQA